MTVKNLLDTILLNDTQKIILYSKQENARTFCGTVEEYQNKKEQNELNKTIFATIIDNNILKLLYI